MTDRPHWIATILLFAVALVASAVATAQERYAGTWRIEKSEPAPWARGSYVIDAKEVRELTGTTVVFKRDHIVGPRQVACTGPHYEIKQYPAEDLFQGELSEMKDAATTPDKMADTIGFGKRPIPSIVTGCATELEFHAIDDDHLVFALNNSLFRMTRVKPAPAKANPKSGKQ